MGARRKGREYALQALYLTDITGVGAEKAFASVTQTDELDPRTREFAKNLTVGAVDNRKQLDEMIKKYAQNWEIGRMAALDRNILRLGAYELMFELDTPISVIIDEAVEIAKTFSTADSGKFVNGILDKIKGERPSPNGKTRPPKD